MDIDQFLATHDGVVSRAQAHACGLSDGQIRRRVRAGRWLRRAPRVFFAAAWTFTPAARVRVAAEWARPRGVLGSVTGAWWLGLPVDSPHPLTLVLDHGHTRRAPPGITVLQHDLGVDRSEHRGLPVVATPLLVLDAAVELGDGGQAFLDRALQTEHVDLDELRRAHHRHLGRTGSAAAGRLIARAGDRAASEPERHLLALLRRAGVVGWSANLGVTLSDGRRAVLDVAFEKVRFAIEVDGWAHHVDHDAFVDDRARKRALVADGWTVIEVTWTDLQTRPGEVLDHIRRTLARLNS